MWTRGSKAVSGGGGLPTLAGSGSSSARILFLHCCGLANSMELAAAKRSIGEIRGAIYGPTYLTERDLNILPFPNEANCFKNSTLEGENAHLARELAAELVDTHSVLLAAPIVGSKLPVRLHQYIDLVIRPGLVYFQATPTSCMPRNNGGRILYFVTTSGDGQDYSELSAPGRFIHTEFTRAGFDDFRTTYLVPGQPDEENWIGIRKNAMISQEKDSPISIS